jgi:hypothetical protein
MKSKETLVLAASIFALTLSAFPHHAAASSTTAPPHPPPATGGTHIKHGTIIVRGADANAITDLLDTIISVLLS